mmetsp:Transcript_4058/g.25496  ORF Transcript_4058/g.25496 Transcript_4058/m.25496 type:complete len:218 (+) Transcript_4058:753-1406(+)
MFWLHFRKRTCTCASMRWGFCHFVCIWHDSAILSCLFLSRSEALSHHGQSGIRFKPNWYGTWHNVCKAFGLLHKQTTRDNSFKSIRDITACYHVLRQACPTNHRSVCGQNLPYEQQPGTIKVYHHGLCSQEAPWKVEHNRKCQRVFLGRQRCSGGVPGGFHRVSPHLPCYSCHAVSLVGPMVLAYSIGAKRKGLRSHPNCHDCHWKSSQRSQATFTG